MPGVRDRHTEYAQRAAASLFGRTHHLMHDNVNTIIYGLISQQTHLRSIVFGLQKYCLLLHQPLPVATLVSRRVGAHLLVPARARMRHCRFCSLLAPHTYSAGGGVVAVFAQVIRMNAVSGGVVSTAPWLCMELLACFNTGKTVDEELK